MSDSARHVRSCTEEGVFVFEYNKNFSKYPTSSNSDRIRFFFNHPQLRKELENWTKDGNKVNHVADTELTSSVVNNDPHKNQAVTKNHRTLGVSLFVKADDERKPIRLMECLQHFNYAILHSSFATEVDRIETSKLFANRSAVFFDLTKFDEALKDIEIALQLGYPFKHKVWIRKARILLLQKKYKEAFDTVKFIQDSQIVGTKEMDKIEEIINSVTKGLTQQNLEKIPESAITNPVLTKRKYNKRSYEENPSFQYASKRLNIAYNDQLSRHVIASENIQPGDILFEEVPFASILLPNKYDHFCYHCHASLDDYIIPCKVCSEVRYCSEECGNISWEEYHSVECLHTSLLQNVGLAQLAVRIVMVAGVDEILNTVKKHQNLNLEDSVAYFRVDKSKVERSINYQRIYSLLEHSDKMKPMDNFIYGKTAAGVTHWLREKTTFFNGRSDEEIYLVGGAILHHICQLISNAQRLYSFCRDEYGEFIEEERSIIGSGIYASTSLMNHSCDPNISTNYKFLPGEGRRLVVKAIREIPVYAEVLNSYGPHYRRHDVRSRQSALSEQYFFECGCDPCQIELDKMKSFVEEFESLNCPSCTFPIYDPKSSLNGPQCPNRNCGVLLDLEKNERLLTEAQELRDKGWNELYGTMEGHNMLHRSYEIYQKIFTPRNWRIASAEDSLARSFISLRQKDKALPYLKRSIENVAARFGRTSNEYGVELCKYVQILQSLGKSEDDEGQKVEVLMDTSFSILENYSPSTD